MTILDPSDIYRPDLPEFADKDVQQFRDFTLTDDPIKQRIFETYKLMHKNQTVDFVRGNLKTYWAHSIAKNCFKDAQ